ncbi:MAG: 4Fe-4S binding protein [Candidatus Cloacimonetes bacterium]|nr:4Fe-4S binding protein [Candidatus Cloacimonadota bacterium]
MSENKKLLKEYFHSVELNRDKCVGCTKCVRICPTEAIRVRDGKAIIDPAKCIDCSQCVAICPVNAINIKSDPLENIFQFKYRLAIISASYEGQFGEEIGYETALKALFHLGFDEIAEQAMITNITAEIIRDYIRTHPKIRPILSSSCPAIVRLVQVRFPSLLTNLLHIESPMSMLAKYYRDKIIKEKGLKEEDIGIFLIVPSGSQVTAVHQPEGTYKHLQDGAISISEIYSKVMDILKELNNDGTKIQSYANGLSWALSGMEAEEVAADDIVTLAISGIHNVIDILSNIESHRLDQYDYIELRNCQLGCVGGELNVENPFVATNRIKKITKNTKKKEMDFDYFFKLYKEGYFDVLPLEPRSIMELDKDIKSALEKMKKVKEIVQILPGLDCGVCGSPTCKALAEDIVQGKAKISDCLVRLKRQKKRQEKEK